MSGNPRIGGLNPDETEMHSGTIDSMPSLGLGELGSEHGVVLRDWSAQDFANIYVRFRPHLISHARKILRQESQAEEVVQDAFLYLMTALPELDSELGVLRFLKWKVRLLCIDIARREPREFMEASSNLLSNTTWEADVDESILRADDAAIVSQALAKLSQNQRKALVLAYFEEKPAAQAASELGLGDNAYRQLLLRSRRSLKRALIGDLETDGLTLNEILSVAVKRNAAKAAASGLALILVANFASPSLSVKTSSVIAGSEPRIEVTEPLLGTQFGKWPFGATSEPLRTAENRGTSFSPESVEGPIASSSNDSEAGAVVENEQTTLQSHSAAPATQMRQEEDDSNSIREFADMFIANLFELEYEQPTANVRVSSRLPQAEVGGASRAQLAFSGDGYEGGLLLGDGGTRLISSLWIELGREGVGSVVLVPTNTLEVQFEEDGRRYVEIVGTDLIFGDFIGDFEYMTFSDLEVSSTFIRIVIDVTVPGDEDVTNFGILDV